MRTTSALLALCALLLLGGCGDDDDNNTQNTPCEGEECSDNNSDNNQSDNNDQNNLNELPWEEQDTTISWTNLEDRPCPEDNTLTWDNFGGPFMLDWCTGCHHSALPMDDRANAPLGVDLESPELVQAQIERIWARSADDNLTMPPIGGPDAMERFYLGQWLACGAP